MQWETGYQYNHISSNSPRILEAGNTYIGTGAGSTSTNGVPLFVSPGYTFKLAPKWRLTLGADHQFLDKNTGSLNSDFGGQGGHDKVSYYDQVSDQTNFFLAPGYLIADGKLAFLKLGYSFESLSLNGADSKAKTSSGYVVGLGYKQMVTRRFYVVAEGHYSQYGRLSPPGTFGANTTLIGSTGNLSALDFTVGIGIKIHK